MYKQSQPLKNLLARIFVLGIVIGLVVGYGPMFFGMLQPQEAIEISEGQAAVQDESTVIEYSSLDDKQKKSFRESMSTGQVMSVEEEQLKPYDYIYLDSEYYPINVVEQRFTYEYIATIAVVAGAGAGILFLVRDILAGGMAVVVSFWSSKEAFDAHTSRFLERIGQNPGKIFGLLALLLVVIAAVIYTSVYAPFAVANQVESPSNGVVIEADELPEEHKKLFYETIAGEEGSNRVLLEYDYVKSDGEYYSINRGFIDYGFVVVSLFFAGLIELGLLAVLDNLIACIERELSGASVFEGAKEG